MSQLRCERRQPVFIFGRRGRVHRLLAGGRHMNGVPKLKGRRLFFEGGLPLQVHGLMEQTRGNCGSVQAHMVWIFLLLLLFLKFALFIYLFIYCFGNSWWTCGIFTDTELVLEVVKDTLRTGPRPTCLRRFPSVCARALVHASDTCAKLCSGGGHMTRWRRAFKLSL